MLDQSKCIDCDYVGVFDKNRNVCIGFPNDRWEFLDKMNHCPLDELKGETMNLVDKIGEAALLEQTAEECVELAKELLKMARKLRSENPTPAKKATIIKHINEEAADVFLCLGELEKVGYIPQEEVMGIVRAKYERMQKRLGEE